MSDRPNILIITTHDTGRHFGCYGVPSVHTPNIDALAREGVRLTNMRSVSPICSPSRVSLLSGVHPHRHGVLGIASPSLGGWEMLEPTRHLSHRLRQHGYSTALIGLQDETNDTSRLGFDATDAAGVKRQGQPRRATDIAQDAANYLRQRAQHPEEPFYAQVGFFETHTPYDFGGVTPSSERGVWMPPYAAAHDWPSWQNILSDLGGDSPEARGRHLAGLQGAVEEVDAAVGMILTALAQSHLDRNTLVLVNVDHGPELPGAKWTLHEPGLGVGFLLRWPDGGLVGGRSVDALLSQVDFLPTLYEWLDWGPQPEFEGVSFARCCSEASSPSPRSMVPALWFYDLQMGLSDSDYNLIQPLASIDAPDGRLGSVELYDLRRDPLETVNLASDPDYAGVLRDMQDKLRDQRAQQRDPSLETPIEGADHEAMLADYQRKYLAARNVS